VNNPLASSRATKKENYKDMKLKLIIAFVMFTLAFSSCKKCVTCLPYHVASGVVGTPDKYTQAIKLCDQTDITAYESLTTFTDAQRDTVKFLCN